MMFRPDSNTIAASVVLALAAFLCFQNLSSPAIRIWDEAIYADNALDMYTYGNPVVMYRNGEPTLYNTKPPLVIWLQTLSMHVFGVGEFAVRFPSALAGVLTALLLLLFAHRTLKDIRIGVIAVLILVTTGGYLHQHVVKTGDLDAVLVLWTTGYTLLGLHVIITRPTRYLSTFIGIGIGLAGAFFSKGVAGYIPLLGLLMCAGVSGRLRWIVTRWHTWLIGGLVVITCLGYYVIRETLIPGYLYRVFYSEISRLYENILPWSNQPWYYYFWNWERLNFFTPYLYVLPLSMIAGIADRKFRLVSGMLTLQVLTVMLILSYPVVKLMWYDAPVYPWLALICAIGLIVIWDAAVRKVNLKPVAKTWVGGLVLCGLFAVPVSMMYQKNAAMYLPVDVLEREGFSIRELGRVRPDIRNYNVLMIAGQNAHYTQVDFYLNVSNRYAGREIGLLRDTSLVGAGDTILCCQEKQLAWLERSFVHEDLHENEIGCRLMHLQQQK